MGLFFSLHMTWCASHRLTEPARRPGATIAHHDDGPGRAVSVAQAVVSQQAQGGVEHQGGQVTQVQQGLHQRNGAHSPVAAELRGVQQQPRIYGKQVVERQLSGGRVTDSCRVIKSTRRTEKKGLSGQNSREDKNTFYVVHWHYVYDGGEKQRWLKEGTIIYRTVNQICIFIPILTRPRLINPSSALENFKFKLEF